MKIEKIKNYNQKLLAILGTIGLVFLIIALISFITFSILDYNRYNYDDTETGILSEEKIEELQKENKREQVISFKIPKLIDTLNSVYIIPVSHKTLNEEEDINVNGLLSSGYSGVSDKKKFDDRYSNSFYGSYNNIIVYHESTDVKKKLFENRVNFNDITVEYFSDDILLILKVAEKDTYRDGVVNLQDFKVLYIYSFQYDELKKVSVENLDTYNYKFLNDSKDMIIQFGIDKNNNGKYEDYNEPTLIKKYQFKTKKLIDIIDKDLYSELQKELEGSKK